MYEIDYGLTWEFIDHDGRPRQMRFRRSLAKNRRRRSFNTRGQLIAVIDDLSRPDYGHEVPLTRPDVLQVDVDHALQGWPEWAMLFAPNAIERYISLVQIRRRLQAADLA